MMRGHGRMRATLKIFVASLLVALAVAWPAAAQPTLQGYNLRAGVTETSIDHNAQAQSGTLPFTGLQIGLVLGAGVVLLGAGLTMRRLSRHPQR